MSEVTDLRASDKILTFSNCISFFRVFLAIPTVIFLQEGNMPATAVIMLIAYISDLLDGYVARKTNTISELGKAIDPVADKIYVGVLVIAMVSKGLVPLWFVLILLGKDVITMIGALVVRKKIAAIPPSNYWGKSAILLTIITLFLSVRGVSNDILLLGWVISALLLTVSFILYAIRAQRLINQVEY